MASQQRSAGPAAALLQLFHTERATLVDELAAEAASPNTDAGRRRRMELLGRLSVLMRLGESYDQALTYAHEHLKLAEQIHGARSVEVAVALRNMAGMYRMQAATRSQAKTILLRALGIFVRCLGEKHQHIVDTLTSLAVLCTSEGNVSEADTYNQRAVAMYYDLRQEEASEDSSSSSSGGSLPGAPDVGAGTGSTRTAADAAGESGGVSPHRRPRAHGTHSSPRHGHHHSRHSHDAAHAGEGSGEEDDDEEDEVCEEFKTFDWTEVVTAMHAGDPRSV